MVVKLPSLDLLVSSRLSFPQLQFYRKTLRDTITVVTLHLFRHLADLVFVVMEGRRLQGWLGCMHAQHMDYIHTYV